jgi:hypothetical protein
MAQAAPGEEIDPSDVLPQLVRLVQTAAQSLVNSTDTPITFTSAAEIDTDGLFNAGSSTTRVTINRNGVYRITGTLFVAATASLTSLVSTIAVNGGVLPPRSRVKPGTLNAAASTQVSIMQRLTAGQYVELWGQQTFGGTLLTSVGGSFASVLEVERLLAE